MRGFRPDSGGYDKIRTAGLTSTAILMWSPTSEMRFPTQDLTSWRDYVAATVRAYPGVRQWEIWNEPPNFTADPSPVSYAKIVVAAHDAAKSVDPGLKVAIATKATNVAWLREAILAGAAGHYDYVTVHPYERAGALVDSWEEPFLAIVPQIRAMLAEADPRRADVPVEFTEVGVPAAQHPGRTDTVSTPEDQARTLVKVLTMSVAQGAQRVSWYDPYDGDYPAGEAAFGLIALDGTPRPSFGAYKNLIAALGDRPNFVGLVQPTKDTYLFVFSRQDRSTAVVGWTQGPQRTVSFPRRVRAMNAVTGEAWNPKSIALGSKPVIVVVGVSSGASGWVTRARTSQVQRTAVRKRVTWSAETGADGLVARGLTEATTVDGRRCLRPSGSEVQLAVGPNFDLRAETVTVTVVARGFRDDPGFNLKYDANDALAELDWAGQRGAPGWKHVTTGQWQTMTWTLGDLRLAGMYGYNFRLDSDGQTYSGYQLASVTIDVVTSRR